MVLEAESQRSAVAELGNCNIQIPEDMLVPESTGLVAENFDDSTAPSDAHSSPPQEPSSDSLPTDIASRSPSEGETPEVEAAKESQEADRNPKHPGAPNRAVSSQSVNGEVADDPHRDTSFDEDNGHEGPPPTDTLPMRDEPSDHRVPFAKLFFGVQERNPRSAPDSPVLLSEGGPKTEESARTDTQESSRFGRQGSRVARSRIRWEPTKASEDLEIKFRNMTRSDYVERCQICGSTFKKRAGEDRQIFVVHIVKPSSDERTNHYGNLIGVCGWHYALMQYGEFEFLDPETELPFAGWHRMRDYILNVRGFDQISVESDTSYVGLPVRFSNVYEKWSEKAVTKDAEIRYCIPHWKYLGELFKT